MIPTDVPQPLFCRTLGQGPRPVLALHCTMAHSGAWRGLAEELGDEMTLHAADMLCHGRSPDWDGQGDFQERMAAAAVAHMSGPMDIIGHSFGATVALRIAVEFPERVRSLTMIESVQFAAIKDSHTSLLAENAQKMGPFHDALRNGDTYLAARLFNRGWGAERGPRWDELPQKSRDAMARGVVIVPACSPSIIEDVPGLMRAGGLDKVDMPVLLMRGGETDASVAAVHDSFATRLPQADNVVVPGAGHMLPITHPGETAAHLRRFLAEVPA